MSQKHTKANEQFFVVGENDEPLPPLPRRLVHGHGVWHRVAHVWVLNSKNELLCQQRSFDKELNPGFWEAFLGGHSRPGESYRSTAKRELREEIGVTVPAAGLELWRVYKQHDPEGYNNEFQSIFLAHWDGSVDDLHFDDGEVARVEWRDMSGVKHAMESGNERWSDCGYEPELLESLAERLLQ